MMILARRVTGQRVRFYEIRSHQFSNSVAWEFAPSPFCSLMRQDLSGPGMCAVGKTVSEARQVLIEAELLNG